MSAKYKIEVLDSLRGSVSFNSLTELANHLSLGPFKVKKFLAGRKKITFAEYEKLVELSYQPRSWAHAGKNRRKK